MPIEVSPSKTTAPISAQPSRSVPINHDENEDLAWECFQKVVTDEDVVACYDMSLKEFEHFVVHDLFKVCNFAFASPCCFTLFSFNKFFIFFYFRQCQSSLQRLSRSQKWTRQGFSLRLGSRGWAKVAAKVADEAK